MISISGKTNEYTLDLNEYPYGHNELEIDSSIDGFPITWGIYYISTPVIEAHSVYGNKLFLNIDLKNLKENGTIILRNTSHERITITVIPNIEETREKNYIFKLGKSTVSGKTITINIVSKENGKTEPWEITRNGSPIGYNISQTKTKLIIELNSILASEFTSNFELLQTNSGKRINFQLKHVDNNSVELIKEAD